MVVVGGFCQVNQSLRWFVDNFALLAEWRAALSRVIKFRETLLRSEDSCEQENRIIYLSDFVRHVRLQNAGTAANAQATGRIGRPAGHLKNITALARAEP
jgi:putative ATP-binding cassette transporter